MGKQRLEELLEEKKKLNNKLLEKTKKPKTDFITIDKANAFIYGKNPKNFNENDDTADSKIIFKDNSKKHRKKDEDPLAEERERILRKERELIEREKAFK